MLSVSISGVPFPGGGTVPDGTRGIPVVGAREGTLVWDAADALVDFRPAVGTPAPVIASIELVRTSFGTGRPPAPGVDCARTVGTSRMNRTVDNLMGRAAYGSAAA
jgi:hypothetical protein